MNQSTTEQDKLIMLQKEMPTLREMRQAARRALKGHWTNAVLCSLVMTVIGVVISLIGSNEVKVLMFIGFMLTLCIWWPLQFGYNVAMLRHMRGEEDDDLVTRPFQAFSQYSRYVGTSLPWFIFISLWTLLLIVPGIIMGIAYSMTPYIMHDHPELSPIKCLQLSKRIMNGYKWKYFCLQLSFIGWALLGVLTLGIGYLWLMPWMSCTYAQFYEELKNRVAVE